MLKRKQKKKKKKKLRRSVKVYRNQNEFNKHR